MSRTSASTGATFINVGSRRKALGLKRTEVLISTDEMFFGE